MELIKTVKIGKRKWKLEEQFSCYFGGLVKVPKGFETNGASVPRVFWWFLDPATELFEAAVVHDYLLSIKNKHAHFIFYKVALHYGVPKYKAKIAHIAVKMYFGSVSLIDKVKSWF
jgi:hypothetical protein